MEKIAEKNESLWLLAASPAVWAAHFMSCYITAAIWCGRIAGPGGSFPTVRAAIVAYTVIAFVAIGVIGYIGLRRHRYGEADLPHDEDSPEDRYRFLGFSTLLLSALSAVAVFYAALTLVFIGDCQ